MNNKSDIEQLFATMMQLGKLMSQQTHESHEEHTATMLQLIALQFLKELPNGTVSDLVNFLQLSKSSTTQLVERLVKAGFVSRIQDKEDRRIVRLNITESGEKKFEALKRNKMGKMQKIFSKLPAQDLRELIRIHVQLIEILKKEENG